MKYLKIIALLGWLVFFSSCENFFDQTTTIDLPKQSPKLGVTALWIDEGNNRLVTVYASVGALENDESAAVSQAEITLSEDGQTVTTFEEDGADKGYYRPLHSFSLVPGKTYELTVSAPNFETVSATQVMPQKPTIKSAQYSKDKYKLRFSMTDQPGENFYLLGIQPPSSSNSGALYTESSFVEESGLKYGRVIFKDESFSEKSLTLSLEAYPYSSADSLLVNLFSVTEDYYRLDRTVSISRDAGDNPFAEPVILHQNFKNGYGVFALGIRDTLLIPVE